MDIFTRLTPLHVFSLILLMCLSLEYIFTYGLEAYDTHMLVKYPVDLTAT
jgi:hypothetical protein